MATAAVLTTVFIAPPEQPPNWPNVLLSLLFYFIIGPGVGRSVDMIRAHAQALLEKDQKYRLFFQRSPLAVVHYDLQGQVTDVNENMEGIAETPRREMIGSSLLALPDENLARAVQDSLAGEITREEFVFHARESEKKVILRGLFAPIYNENQEIEYGMAFLEDISDITRAEDALKRFRTAIDSSPDAIFIIQRSTMRFVDANVTACEELGYSCEELLQMGPHDIKPHYNCEELSETLDGFIANATQKGVIKTVHQRKDKTTYPVEVFIQPFESEGEYYLTAIGRDITRQQEAEKELILARERAEIFALAKSRFLANMSHAIRTPMQVVIGMSELLHESTEDRENKEIAAMIGQSANSLLGIINDVLDYSRLEAGQDTLMTVTFNLKQELERTINVFSLQAYQKGLSLELSIEPAVPLMLCGDPLRLRLVLINLLSNALQYTKQGQVTLKVSSTGSLPEEGEKQVLSFAVHDTGPGIAPEKLELVFDSFQVLEYSNTRELEGPGLGLATAKRLVEMMGGTISVDSTPREGSTFTCLIPLSLASGEVSIARGEKPVPHRTSAPEGVAALAIMLVEDKPMNQKLTRTLLEQRGWSVQSACNGLEAVELFKQHDFDLIIMDIQMPKMDGLQATTLIRQEEEKKGSYTPIIAMTAYAQDEDRGTFIKAGMDDLLRKPITKEQLYAAVEALIRQ